MSGGAPNSQNVWSVRSRHMEKGKANSSLVYPWLSKKWLKVLVLMTGGQVAFLTYTSKGSVLATREEAESQITQ